MLAGNAMVVRPQTHFTLEGQHLGCRQFRYMPALKQLLDDLLGTQ